MSNRLNQQREKELQPKRIELALKKLSALGYTANEVDDTKIKFLHKGQAVVFFPYSGWHSGKSIKDGRGLENLLKQLKS